jgi:uncharacterized OsmC-like protein
LPARWKRAESPQQTILEADVEGRIEGDDKFFRIAAVSLRYKLKILKGKRPEADRALAHREDYCPVHMSIKKGFEVSWSAEIEEA